MKGEGPRLSYAAHNPPAVCRSLGNSISSEIMIRNNDQTDALADANTHAHTLLNIKKCFALSSPAVTFYISFPSHWIIIVAWFVLFSHSLMQTKKERGSINHLMLPSAGRSPELSPHGAEITITQVTPVLFTDWKQANKIISIPWMSTAARIFSK